MSRLALAAVLASATFCLGACDDPQHGAWKVKSGIWLSLTLLDVIAGLFLVGIVSGWAAYKLRHRSQS